MIAEWFGARFRARVTRERSELRNVREQTLTSFAANRDRSARFLRGFFQQIDVHEVRFERDVERVADDGDESAEVVDREVRGHPQLDRFAEVVLPREVQRIE